MMNKLDPWNLLANQRPQGSLPQRLQSVNYTLPVSLTSRAGAGLEQDKVLPGEGSTRAATTVKSSALCEQAPMGLPLTPSDLTYSFFLKHQALCTHGM